MIVVDTNTLAYLYLPTGFTEDVEALLYKDSQWVAPMLWRSEFRNILSLYVRKQLMDLETALQMQAHAERLLAGNEFAVNSSAVLALARDSGCSAYDCEFIYVATSLNARLITHDRKLHVAFPEIAISAAAYLQAAA